MPKPCLNRNNHSCSIFIVAGLLLVLKIAEVLDCEFIDACILVIAVPLLFALLGRYLKK